MSRKLSLVSACLFLGVGAATAQDFTTPARELFGAVSAPSAGTSRAVGFYSGGCLAGGVSLPVEGDHWLAMRVSRNRNWGHPSLIAYLEALAADAALDGWPGLLVGDMSQPRGGPMIGSHVSHQTGLYVDIWYRPMPEATLTPSQREELGATSLVRQGTLEVDSDLWSENLFNLLRRAASYPEVERIFVHPGIKKELCEAAGEDRDWLQVIRPWYGHADHFHVRLECPAGSGECEAQAPSPVGDGCGEELAWWLGPEPYRPPDIPATPSPPATLADLPSVCSVVLAQPGIN